MRLRLIASFILIVLVAIGIFFIVTVRQTRQEVRNFIARGGLTGSEDVVLALEEYYDANGTWDGVMQVLRTASRYPRGRMLGQRVRPNQGTQADIPLPNLWLADSEGNLVANARGTDPLPEFRLNQNQLSRGVPLEVDGENVGYLVQDATMVYTTASEVSLLSRLNRAAIIAVVIAGSAAILLALLLSYSLVRPVHALTAAASNLAKGDLSQRVQANGNDELATLGRAFNQMAESLQLAEETRRAMTADIAHELRTPLAVQRAHIEAIEDGVYPLSLDSLATIEEQNRLLTRLVEDLRTLAMADAGRLDLELVPTDFSDLVRRIARRFEPQAAEIGVVIELSLDEPCPKLLVDPQRIQQILHNLLSNALRYSPQGGRILQDLVCRKDHISLSVRDSGPGIPEDALPNIFERFYRSDRSRSRSEGGTGLGLSIARKLAQAHGGDLKAENHPEGGAIFTLDLPIGSAEGERESTG